MAPYHGASERERKERDTPERILQLARAKGEFRVSLRYRDDWLRGRCARLKLEGLLTGGRRIGREVVFYPAKADVPPSAELGATANDRGRDDPIPNRTQEPSPSAAQSVGEWQPIETAPRDGSPILAMSTNHEAVEVVCWQDGLPSGSAQATAAPEEGWVNSGAMKDRFYANPRWFTHWMPLPTPAQSVAGGEG